MPNQTAASLPETSAAYSQELTDLIVDSIQDIKGKRIVSIDLREVDDSPSDFFIICEGESNVQVRAIADNVQRRARAEYGERSGQIEGLQAGNWVCIDYFNTVVHVFSPEARSFYDLESLWSDAPSTSYEDL